MVDPHSSKPSISEDIIENATAHLKKGKDAKSHQAKVVALSNFLDDIFGVDIDDILPGIEEKIGSQVLGLSGRIDVLYDNIVFEVKTDFNSERSDAIDKLENKYFPTLLEDSPKTRHIALITDLEQFELVKPVVDDGRIVGVESIDTHDTRQSDTKESIFWIDSALFSGHVKAPSADELTRKFGPNAPTYNIAIEELEDLWAKFIEENSDDARLNLWGRMMEIVYGDVPDESAFVSQTYLSMLVKILVRLRLNPSVPTDENEYIDVITGDFFEEYGITNLIEEDFYTWILDDSVREDAADIFVDLAQSLNIYDLDLAQEDLFKEVYQEIVAANQRHGTGEYYTPRWLCEYTLNTALEQYGSTQEEFPRILDPACGSGGFLTEAIHACLETTDDFDDKETIDKVTSKVQGIDVNPLAVIIARSNYIIALGELLESSKEITIPIFASDSINLPDLRPSLHGGVNCYAVEAEDKDLMIPQSVAEDGQKRVEVLNVLSRTTRQYRADFSENEGELTHDQAKALFNRQLPDHISDNENTILKQTLQDLLQFVDNGRDHIWIYVLNNFYAPTMLQSEPFDLIIGNPPWIVMRSIENDQYQEFLKKSIQEYNLLDPSNINLYTHMEMATLFFRKSSDIYLREEGYIGFIMPIGVTSGALQHQKFNDFDTPKMRLASVHSFKGVSDIFSLPPCILYAKKGESTEYPVSLIEWSGSTNNLPRNTQWNTVSTVISSEEGEYSPAEIPSSESPYYDDFGQGTTINPRNLFYIDFVKSKRMGINPQKPLVKTSEAVAKVAGKKWKDIIIEGQVESEFIHASYLGKDLMPFGKMPPRPVVLPLIIENSSRILLQSEGLRNRGFPEMANWLEEAQEAWVENRTDKADNRFPHITDRINYQNLLINQDPTKRYIVIYNGRGADSFATVLDRENLDALDISGATIEFADFIADQTNRYHETNSEDEAHYLCAVLNSHEIHQAVKPFQPEGAYGHRDIGRRPFKLPIPEFDSDEAAHINLADLSREGHKLISGIDFDEEYGFRKRRNITNEVLEEDGLIDRIDKIVLSLGITGTTIVDNETEND